MKWSGDAQFVKLELDHCKRFNGLFGNAYYEHPELQANFVKLTGESEEQINNEISKTRNLDKIIRELNNKVKVNIFSLLKEETV